MCGVCIAAQVSYNSKHNEANGEQGRDGCNDNDSWNCGAEGGTSDEGINAQRLRMMKTFHLVLMVSQGTPMMLMGDEYGHTKHGNNNTYGHDSRLSWFQWDALEKEREAFFRFCAKATHFRRKHPLLGRSEFLTSADVTWHEKSWDDPESRFLMLQLHQHGGAGSLLAAFNAHSFAIDPLSVPPPPAGCVWSRVVRPPAANTLPHARVARPSPLGPPGRVPRCVSQAPCDPARAHRINTLSHLSGQKQPRRRTRSSRAPGTLTATRSSPSGRRTRWRRTARCCCRR